LKRLSINLLWFIPAKDGARLVAGIEVEVLGDVGLLRSLPISPAYTRQGIAQILCDKLEHQAEEFKNICPTSSACMVKGVQMFLHHP
jgi:N-acetylglutamate synthase-like GNAT family acetyltransferase